MKAKCMQKILGPASPALLHLGQRILHQGNLLAGHAHHAALPGHHRLQFTKGETKWIRARGNTAGGWGTPTPQQPTTPPPKRRLPA